MTTTKPIKLTWYGTASLSLETGTTRILIDPFLTLRGSEHRTSVTDFETDMILLTHGHVDHISSIPEIMSRNEESVVFCTETPAATLEKKGVPGERIMCIQPGISFAWGDIRVHILKGRHIRFDRKLVRHTLINLRMVRYVYNVPFLLRQNRICQEHGETVAYLLEAGGRTILILGSLGLDEQEVYPAEPDLLVLPYQGATNLIPPALVVIDRIRPRAVMLDHFDDAFPPVSASIDTKSLFQVLNEKYPDMKIIKPEAGIPVYD
jgi:L-ascorbate metabolism protein UlaG (beta-lactamase superfamily)